MPTLYYVSYNDNTALTTALANGEADWAQAFIPNVQSAYLDKDKEHNVFWAAAGLAVDAMFVNTQTKPFNDPAFRQAVNLVIDREQHQQIAREGGVPELSSVTGLPTPAGDAFIASEFEGEDYTVDAKAREAGPDRRRLHLGGRRPRPTRPARPSPSRSRCRRAGTTT